MLGIVLSEVGEKFQPQHLFLIASPPYVQFFFAQIIRELGCKKAVDDAFIGRVEEVYHQPISHFDLRSKVKELRGINKLFVYCENDEMIPFKQGRELYDCHENKNFLQARGFGPLQDNLARRNYKICSRPFRNEGGGDDHYLTLKCL